MPQMGFFVGGAGVGIANLPIGVARFLIAWDPFDGGTTGAMYQVYEWISPCAIVGGGKIRNYNPIKVPKLPEAKGYFGLEKYIVKFKLESGGVSYSEICDLTFEVYDDDSKLIYTVAPATDKPLKVKIKGIMIGQAVSFQTRLKSLPFNDAKDKFEALMTSDGPLPILPF